MEKEEVLYKLIESLDNDNMSGLGIGVHESSFCDCQFPEEEYGFRIYHKDGYCFDITKEKEYPDDTKKDWKWYYEYHEGVFDGFKSLTIENAIKIIETEGVFQ